MAYDGTLEDFDTEAQANVLFNNKKKGLKNDKPVNKIAPSCHMHRCYHDETPPKPCEVISHWEKE